MKLIVMSDFTESWAYRLLQGVMKYSNEGETWVITRMPPSFRQKYGLKGVLKWAKKWGANAIIGQFEPYDKVDMFYKNGIVAIAQDYKKRFRKIPNITSDYRKCGRMAADFFINKGFRNFAFFGYKNVVWSQERYEGFRDRIAEKGFIKSLYDNQSQSLENLWFYDMDEVRKWVRTLPPSTAMLACDDTQASKIIEVCKLEGINVPSQIAILGVDDDNIMCNLSDPAISSISYNLIQGGYDTAKLIDKLVKNPDAKISDINLQPITIVSRKSTDIYATTDPAILKTLNFIHDNLGNKLSVNDIVKQVPLSRRLLEIRFKKATGQTIHNYINTLRMNKFSELLVSSNRPIVVLAEEVGLSVPANVSRQFKSWSGMTPQEFRAQKGIELSQY